MKPNLQLIGGILKSVGQSGGGATSYTCITAYRYVLVHRFDVSVTCQQHVLSPELMA